MSQGLWVAFLGMAMVFLALGMLIVVIMLLDRAFRPRPVQQEPEVSPEKGAAQSAQEDKAMAAAVGLATALALRTEYRSPQGGQQRSSDRVWSQPSQPSAWRLLGRRHQMASPDPRWQIK